MRSALRYLLRLQLRTPCRKMETDRTAGKATKTEVLCRRSPTAGARAVLPASRLSCVAPGLVPILAGCIDDPPVGLEKFVGDLKNREHQPAFRTPGDVTATGLTPDELAGSRLDPFRWTFLVDQMAFEDIGLLDIDVLVVRQHRARCKTHQRRHQACLPVEQQCLGFATWKAGLLPFHVLRADEVRMLLRGLSVLR